jgi:UDP-N-acetylglucosamine--N-acetylmuramyl-(pentapeptide) pyrophosphoryl-undecaprenol N-acetylglucosamine transferase
MRMVVAGGGTGGHLFPGLAVAEAVAADGGARVLFVGSAYGIEARAVPKTQFAFAALAIRGVRGRGLRGALEFITQAPAALLRARSTLTAFRPTIVLGLGGYGSVPVVIAAWVRRIPIVLLEQNVRPGLANRWLAHLARRICTTFAESAAFFPEGKAQHTGNPVRQFNPTQKPAPGHFTIFAFGGSQGARAINRAMLGAAKVVGKQLLGLRVIHQTGEADVEWVRLGYKEMGVEAEVLPFVHDMAGAYSRADLVICRSGATTVAELAIVGKASILIPYPFHADQHQRLNAEVLQRRGAAEVITNDELTGEKLAASIMDLACDRERLAAMGAAARAAAVPDATARVVAVCREVAAEGGRE